MNDAVKVDYISLPSMYTVKVDTDSQGNGLTYADLDKRYEQKITYMDLLIEYELSRGNI